ncbi:MULTISPECIES: hypothetical protein [Lentzea]|uniref:Uncharacterized protein n=1 Tax=Lentzea albida TaxID=65499 RepID=A0A1H9U875_9PSEU|nr:MULTISPECIES: hypothetical protein [Lentzea]USX48723.1 hypothetical protein ND450_24985 [Lentzea sp. HUAS12]SES05354.1 hypothetical protein SAMN04488000_11570 [Lentzea albida]
MSETSARGRAAAHGAEHAGPVQKGALVASVVIAGVVGVWSYFFAESFFDHFPVVLGEWISQDGPYNEHLVRDHGAMYLALGAGSVFGLLRPSRHVYQLLGIAWTVFGVLHIAYHVAHLGHMSRADAIGQVTVLGVAVLLAVALFAPGRSPASR